MVGGTFMSQKKPMMKKELLSDDAIAEALVTPPGWQVEKLELVRTVAFGSYLAGAAFVQEVAVLAEKMNHHPDLGLGWRKVTIRLSTHSAGGLTGLDIDLARQIQTLCPAG